MDNYESYAKVTPSIKSEEDVRTTGDIIKFIMSIKHTEEVECWKLKENTNNKRCTKYVSSSF